jgi:hypothetical protein
MLCGVSSDIIDVSKDRSDSIFSIHLSIHDTPWRIHGDAVKCVHREADNRTRRFKSSDVLEADPVSKNYFPSRHGVNIPSNTCISSVLAS